MYSKYELAICELYNSNIHGYTERSYDYIDGHYIIFWVISLESFLMCDDYKDVITLLVSGYYIFINSSNHPTIRNYNNIIKSENYIKLDIIENVELDSGEMIAIIKTFWIKIIQRKWKKYYYNLLNKIQYNKNISNRIKIELNGK